LVLSMSRNLKQKSVECGGWILRIRERSKVVALLNYIRDSEDAEVEETSPPSMMKLFKSANLISGIL
jgi:uncharacterized protein with NRDE domain